MSDKNARTRQKPRGLIIPHHTDKWLTTVRLVAIRVSRYTLTTFEDYGSRPTVVSEFRYGNTNAVTMHHVQPGHVRFLIRTGLQHSSVMNSWATTYCRCLHVSYKSAKLSTSNCNTDTFYQHQISTVVFVIRKTVARMGFCQKKKSAQNEQQSVRCISRIASGILIRSDTGYQH